MATNEEALASNNVRNRNLGLLLAAIIAGMILLSWASRHVLYYVVFQ